MADAKKKKPSSIDDVMNSGADAIVTYYQQYSNDDFKTRIGKNKEFHEKKVFTTLDNEAYEIHQGGSSPGALQEGYLLVDKYAKKEQDVIESEDKIKDILESYAMGFLKKANKKEDLAALEEMTKKGATKAEVRAFLNERFSAYHLDRQGRPVGILDQDDIKDFVGRDKAEIKRRLRAKAAELQGAHANYLQSRVFEGYFKQDRDQIPLVKHMEEQMAKDKLIHPNHKKTLYTRSFPDLVQDLSAYNQNIIGQREYVKAPAKK
jgi:hypothetical protein